MRPQFGIWDRQTKTFDPANVSRSGKQTIKPARDFMEKEHMGQEAFRAKFSAPDKACDGDWRRYVIRRTGK